MARQASQAVLRSEELPREAEPLIRRVRVGSRDVLLSRLGDGVVVAFGATCPHQDTPLDGATFWDGSLRCSLHNYLYDPRTGENILPARDARPENLWKLKPGYLPTYRVEERDGWIWVAERPEGPPPGYDPGLEVRPRARQAVPTHPAPVAPAAAGPVEHAGEEVTVALGQTFELVLATTPRPGHFWRVELSGGLASLSERFQPGEPPRHCVNLRATDAGEASVRCAYGRPWDSTPAEVRSFVVRVEAASS